MLGTPGRGPGPAHAPKRANARGVDLIEVDAVPGPPVTCLAHCLPVLPKGTLFDCRKVPARSYKSDSIELMTS